MLHVSSPAALRTTLFASLCLVSAVRAQWSSAPHNPPNSVVATPWYVAHDTGVGLAACSAMAQSWLTVSPAGASFRSFSDASVITQETPTLLRGWSAFSNSSATQVVAAGGSPQSNTFALTYNVMFDQPPTTFGVLRGYSAYTNTWASLPLTQLQSYSLVTGNNVAVQREGLAYHAYSAYTGQWVTLPVAVDGGAPFVGSDYVAVDLRGTAGPFQYAAFSGPRGTWTLSPVYPTTGAGQVAFSTAAAFAIRTDIGIAGSFRYAGYSPFTGQWNTSSLVHTTGSSQTGNAFGHVVRIADTDPNARYEIFGAGNGVWQSLTGPGLAEESVHEDFHVVLKTGTPSTVYIASALVGGGYASVNGTTFSPGVTPGSHMTVVTTATSPATQFHGYSPATNSFAALPPQAGGFGILQSGNSAVAGVLGNATSGNAHAFSTRWGTWVAGPSTVFTNNYSWLSSGTMLVANQTTPSNALHIFDEHQNIWLPPVALPTPVPLVGVGPNCAFYTDGSGTYHAYSSQRGTWLAQSGIGSITSPGGLNVRENLLWFTDSNNLIWVFSTPARTQTWQQWPASSRFVASGSTPGGATPFVGVSARGTPTEYGLLYASLALTPAPLTIPGLLGSLDLDPFGAVQAADLGLFDADGIREAKLRFHGVVPHGTRLWFQLITVDLVSGVINLTDRASGACIF